MKSEKENKLSFPNIEIIHKQGKLITTVYQKPIFRGTYTNFERFLS